MSIDQGDRRHLNVQTREVWDANAAFWDDRMAEGNDFHLTLVAPAAERLLDLSPGEDVLEIACGTGQFSRAMAELGVNVLATDFSERMLEHAARRSDERPELKNRLSYQLIDATDEDALLALGEGRFDAAVCNMGIMDMAEIEPMLRALRRLLKPDGRFVFTIMHPAFNSMGTRLCVEEEDRDGELVETYSIRVISYLTVGDRKGTAMRGQPVAQWYFHRPLHELFNACFAAGFVLDGIEEPAFLPEEEPSRFRSWQSYPEIPPVLAARLRPNRRSAG
jgi:ubiquinone/menaquinone biosynthesis C-methylase UbiE